MSMPKSTREFWARLLLGLLLLFLGAIALFRLSFESIGLIVALLEFADGALWISTLFP